MTSRLLLGCTLLLACAWAKPTNANSDYDPCMDVEQYRFLSMEQDHHNVIITWKEFGNPDLEGHSGQVRRLVRADCREVAFVFEGTLGDAELVQCGLLDQEYLDCCSYQGDNCTDEDAEYCEYRAVDERLPSGTVKYYLVRESTLTDSGWVTVLSQDFDVSELANQHACPYRDGGDGYGCSVRAIPPRTTALGLAMLAIGVAALLISRRRTR